MKKKEKKQPDVLSNIVVTVLICAFLSPIIPPIVTCLFIAVGYLAYEAYKK